MFRILGQDALYVEIADVFKKRLGELAEEGSEFAELLEGAEPSYIMNSITEEHTFFLRVPDEYTPEQIQTMCDAALAILKATVEEVPCIEVNGIRQKYQVVITNWEEPELIGLRKTPGMSSEAVFKPIFESLDAPGKMNSAFQDDYL